jgi:hypothetical protein
MMGTISFHWSAKENAVRAGSKPKTQKQSFKILFCDILGVIVQPLF